MFFVQVNMTSKNTTGNRDKIDYAKGICTVFDILFHIYTQ